MKKYNDTTGRVPKNNPEIVDGRYGNDDTAAIPGINTPGIELPAFNPPVPNRAWTAMRQGKDIDDLTDEEREEIYEQHFFD